MIFSYNWLKEYVKVPKPDKLAEILTMHAFEVESVNKIKGDYVLDIDILPNRGPDCFSHIGIAREIAAITNAKLKIPVIKLKEGKIKAKDAVSIKVDSPKDCIRYTAKVIKDIKIKESPKDIKNKLIACGLKPINNVVDAANYVMLETGQPLHAFDLDKIQGAKLVIRRAKKGEKILTLDGGRYELDSNDLVIADEKDVLAIAGIKGGKKAEIDKNTKNIVLESANFDSSLIRRTSKKIKLKTDASWRFEHSIDPNLTESAVNKLVGLLKGKLASGIVDFYPKKASIVKIKLDIDYVGDLLGIGTTEKDIKSILERLGFKYNKGIVEVPTFRLDISLPEDLIEEVGRLYGYEKIASVFPVASLIPPKKNYDIFWENISKNILKELGFAEVYNYSFIGEDKSFKGIELENPMSSEQKYLRPSLIPNLLKNAEQNLKYFDNFNIFELGKVFTDKGEKRMLTGVSTGSFYQIKGAVDSLLNKLGISDIYYDDYEATPEDSKISVWKKGKTAEIKVNGKEVGFLGKISKVNVFDIDFEKLAKLSSEESEYRPISQYPSAVRDIAVLIPLDVQVIDVMNVINSAGGVLVKDVDLFDIYEGEGIPDGQKNLAFHIIYQAKDKTLTASEIDKIHNKIINALEQNSQWQVRK